MDTPSTFTSSALFNQNNETAVLIFSKAPIAGQVKTRLAKTVGDQAALETYKAMLTVIVERISDLSHTDIYISAANQLDHPFFIDLMVRYSLKGHLQCEGNLGDKMWSALSQLLKNYQKVVIIGGDALPVMSQHIEEMVTQLNTSDIAVIPSEDGGYVAIGASKVTAGMFDDIAWGTEVVFEQQLQRFEAERLTVWQGKPLWDLDDETDFQKFVNDDDTLNRMRQYGFKY